jgi:hypothetical protein
VIAAVVDGYNVRVLAVPGAGKTFTMEHLAAKLRAASKRVLCLTYSCVLKNEWRDKNPDYKTDIHSFHSLACTLYPGTQIHDDVRLKRLLVNPPTEIYRPVGYDVFLIDETQDMCSLHYRLLADHYTARQLVVVGQIRQCVFEYKADEETRADTGYLERPWETMKTLAAAVDWQTLRLTLSFRLTQMTANFINRLFVLSNNDVIQGHRIKAVEHVDVHVLEQPDPKVDKLPKPTAVRVTALCEGPLSLVDSALFVCDRKPHPDPYKYEVYPAVSADYQPCVSALYGDTSTFLAEQWYTKEPPSAYLRIFNPLPIGSVRTSFAKHLLESKTIMDDPELHQKLDRFVWDVGRHRTLWKTQ